MPELPYIGLRLNTRRIHMNEAALTDPTPEDDPMDYRDTRIEQLLTDWKLTFEFDPNFPLSRLKIEDATQIRLAQHRAPSATVEQYVIHMRHGANFPPIVVGTNAMLVDGNARVEASSKIGRKTFPAYKVKFPHLGMAKMIGAALNQMGGDRLTEEEIVVAAEAMISAGHPDEAIARTLGRSVRHIRNVRKDRDFWETFERLELPKDAVISKQIARSLASIAHDEPFRAAVEAVLRAEPSPKAVSRMVAAIDKTRSDADALATIQAAEKDWGPLTGLPPGRSLSRSQAKKALTHVRALLEAGEAMPADLVLDDTDAGELWRRLNVLTPRVVALYPPQPEVA